MPAAYRIFGAELSPYSVKVRSYFRYKRIPHEWVVRRRDNMAEFERHAKLPLIPLVLGDDGFAMQDSTPILQHFERLYPRPSLQPADPASAFLSTLLEEYADEWANKPMFHYRWFYEVDRRSAADRIAAAMLPEAGAEERAATARSVRERMVGRLGLVGSSSDTREQIESSLFRQVAVLQRHLAGRPYLFGGRPALADFGLAAQHYEMTTDPTAGALLRAHAPAVVAWAERMLEPRNEGPFEPWDVLRTTLRPFVAREIGQTFLPWSVANARALAAGEPSFSVTLDGMPFSQAVQKYPARSLAALKAAYRAALPNPALDDLLADSDCLRWLRAA